MTKAEKLKMIFAALEKKNKVMNKGSEHILAKKWRFFFEKCSIRSLSSFQFFAVLKSNWKHLRMGVGTYSNVVTNAE